MLLVLVSADRSRSMSSRSSLMASGGMEFSKLSKKNLRYLSNTPHVILYMLPNSPLPQPCTVPTPTPPSSVILSTGSSRFCAKTYPSYHSLCFHEHYHGLPISSSFQSHGFTYVFHKTHSASRLTQILGFSGCNRRYTAYSTQRLDLYSLKSRYHGCSRSYSSSALNYLSKYKNEAVLDKFKRKAIQQQVAAIIDLVRGDECELESKLDALNVRLSVASAIVLFRVLNCEKTSALRFFLWIRGRQPELGINPDVCSLVIDNCGYLNDFAAMIDLMKDFSMFRCCLTKEAFGFLNVVAANKKLLMESTQSVVDALREVGGPTYGSGVHSLIEMLCVLGSFDVAKFVILKMERRMSYYHVLIREMCRRRDFKEARDMLDEMKEEGCAPSAANYNYIISSLLKNGRNDDAIEVFQEMLNKDCPPDVLTFEIFIYNCCKLGNIQVALEYLEKMMERGLKPRPKTHAAFIKLFFSLQQYDEAISYVVGSDDYSSINANYSLLANLYMNMGNLVAARNILCEMIRKGIRPNCQQYKIVWRQLNRTGREDLAMDLQEQFRQFDFT